MRRPPIPPSEHATRRTRPGGRCRPARSTSDGSKRREPDEWRTNGGSRPLPDRRVTQPDSAWRGRVGATRNYVAPVGGPTPAGATSGPSGYRGPGGPFSSPPRTSVSLSRAPYFPGLNSLRTVTRLLDG